MHSDTLIAILMPKLALTMMEKYFFNMHKWLFFYVTEKRTHKYSREEDIDIIEMQAEYIFKPP